MKVDIILIAKVFNVVSVDDIDTLEDNYNKVKFLEKHDHKAGLLHHIGWYDDSVTGLKTGRIVEFCK